jgi:hypothetical protein
MCDINENVLNQEEEYVGYEEQMGLISVDEELKRIQIQDNPISEASEDTKNSNFYKESMMTIETVGEAFQRLLQYGVDYSNALAIASNLVQNDVTLKQQKIVQATQEQNQV